MDLYLKSTIKIKRTLRIKRNKKLTIREKMKWKIIKKGKIKIITRIKPNWINRIINWIRKRKFFKIVNKIMIINKNKEEIKI